MSKADRGYIAVEGPEDADWIKAVRWDLPTDFRLLVLSLYAQPDLKQQKAALSDLMNLNAWQAAPPRIKAQAATFLAGTAPVV